VLNNLSGKAISSNFQGAFKRGGGILALALDLALYIAEQYLE